MRVEAAVFDLGGVLIDGGPREVVAFGDRVGLDDAAWEDLRRDLFGNDGPWAELERGELPFDRFVAALKQRVREAGGTIDDEIAASFMGARDPMSRKEVLRPRLLDAVARVREVVPTALLTNNVREWRKDWRGTLDLDLLFDVVIDSSAVGARKPEPAIYEITRAEIGVSHESIFFVDDIGQNLKAARRLGWQTHLYTGERELLTILGGIRESGTRRATAERVAHAKTDEIA
jgi:putative hydrolase of the HAD superfamily